MNNDFNNITSNEFCDLQGISDVDRFVINKKFKGIKKSYNDWYNTIQVDFQVGIKKEFKTAEKPPVITKPKK